MCGLAAGLSLWEYMEKCPDIKVKMYDEDGFQECMTFILPDLMATVEDTSHPLYLNDTHQGGCNEKPDYVLQLNEPPLFRELDWHTVIAIFEFKPTESKWSVCSGQLQKRANAIFSCQPSRQFVIGIGMTPAMLEVRETQERCAAV